MDQIGVAADYTWLYIQRLHCCVHGALGRDWKSSIKKKPSEKNHSGENFDFHSPIFNLYHRYWNGDPGGPAVYTPGCDFLLNRKGVRFAKKRLAQMWQIQLQLSCKVTIEAWFYCFLFSSSHVDTKPVDGRREWTATAPSARPIS